MNTKFILLLFVAISFSFCKIDNKEFDSTEVNQTDLFADAIVDNTVIAAATVKNVGDYALEVYTSNILLGTPQVSPRSNCDNTTITGNTITTCYTDTCLINGTKYTGCFDCIFSDINDPNSDIDVVFLPGYSINCKEVTGIMDLDYITDSADCKVYNLDSLNLNTIDGGYHYNFFEAGNSSTQLRYCNGFDLNILNDVIYLNPSPTVTNIESGDFCNTVTTEFLEIDYNCGHSYPVNGLTVITQIPPGGHIPVSLGTLDFGVSSNCDSIVQYADHINNVVTNIDMSQ